MRNLTFTPGCNRWQVADRFLRESNNGRGMDSRKLQNNTYLLRLHTGDIAVRLHSTDVVTYHRDGSCTLNTGRWETVTTKDRINGWSPASVYSERGTWCVWHRATDPLTPAKLTRCRVCHGTGSRLVPEREERTCGGADVSTGHGQCDLGFWHYRRSFLATPEADGGAEAQTHRVETGRLVPESCYNCGGAGQVDRGSRPDPVVFEDGMRVDRDGRAMGRARDLVRYSQRAERAKREAERAKRARARHQRALERERAEHRARVLAMLATLPTGPADDGGPVFYKGVTVALGSPVQTDGRALTYTPGTRVVADGLDTSGAGCGAGVNFCETPEQAAGWCPSGNGLVVAVRPLGKVVRPLVGDKRRAIAVDVLCVYAGVSGGDLVLAAS